MHGSECFEGVGGHVSPWLCWVAVGVAPGSHDLGIATLPCMSDALLGSQAIYLLVMANDQGLNSPYSGRSKDRANCDGGEWSPDGVIKRSGHVKHTVVDVHLSPKVCVDF